MGRTIAYFDCFSGASGDMLLGALLDAGLELDALRAGLAQIGIAAEIVSASSALQHGITGTQLHVQDDGTAQPARTLPAVRELLQNSGLSEQIVHDSLHIFTLIAQVEGSIHGLAPDEVHFHELSAVDSLVDIVGFQLGINQLGLQGIFSSPLPLGHGSVKTAHGNLPLPAPATLALLAQAKAPTIPSSAQVELVTPTGAGILASCATFRQPAMAIQRVGYGMGTRELPWANIVRVWIGEELDLPAARHEAAEHQHAADGSHTHTHDGHTHSHAEGSHAHEHTGQTHEHSHDA